MVTYPAKIMQKFAKLHLAKRHLAIYAHDECMYTCVHKYNCTVHITFMDQGQFKFNKGINETQRSISFIYHINLSTIMLSNSKVSVAAVV